MGGFDIVPGERGIESWEMDRTLTFPLSGIELVDELDIVLSAGRS